MRGWQTTIADLGEAYKHETSIILLKVIIFMIYLRCITGYDIITNVVYRQGLYFEIEHAICMNNVIQFWIIIGPMKYVPSGCTLLDFTCQHSATSLKVGNHCVEGYISRDSLY